MTDDDKLILLKQQHANQLTPTMLTCMLVQAEAPHKNEKQQPIIFMRFCKQTQRSNPPHKPQLMFHLTPSTS
ncbi:hypothetical protein [Klebsiella pneumoniae]